MTFPILSSTFLLTLLLLIGLFFFIRASTKDRTEQLQLESDMPPSDLHSKVKQYFEKRAYRMIEGDNTRDLPVKLVGWVRPSLFLATFLTFLAAVGMVCLALVLGILFPRIGYGFSSLLALSPVAGWFYWRRAGRPETVQYSVEARSEDGSRLIVTAHRDELISLRQALFR